MISTYTKGMYYIKFDDCIIYNIFYSSLHGKTWCFWKSIIESRR